MQVIIILAVSLHVLAAVMWMGSTANLARTGAVGAEVVFSRQMMGVAVVVLTGGFLWSQLHSGGFGTYERVLAVGVVCAILALTVQVAMVGMNLGRLKTDATGAVRRRMAVGHRVAAGLLSVTLVAMVVARYIS